MEKLSNPQKLQPQGNGRDETVQFIINQLNQVAGQLEGDIPSAISAVHPHRGENKKKKTKDVSSCLGEGRVSYWSKILSSKPK